MQNRELLIAECLRSLGELRLQKGWWCSVDAVLRAAFGLCLGGSRAEPHDRDETKYQHNNESSHDALSVICNCAQRHRSRISEPNRSNRPYVRWNRGLCPILSMNAAGRSAPA